MAGGVTLNALLLHHGDNLCRRHGVGGEVVRKALGPHLTRVDGSGSPGSDASQKLKKERRRSVLSRRSARCDELAAALLGSCSSGSENGGVSKRWKE